MHFGLTRAAEHFLINGCCLAVASYKAHFLISLHSIVPVNEDDFGFHSVHRPPEYLKRIAYTVAAAAVVALAVYLAGRVLIGEAAAVLHGCDVARTV